MILALRRLERFLPACYLAGVVWINAYLCRQIFFIQYTCQMHSMHGFWMAMARLAGDAWYKPSWWPYWFGGMPFEFTYAPSVPFLIAVIARLGAIPIAQALDIVCGLVFCLGPATLFLLAWQLTRRPGWSFLAAVVYSLSALSELVVPDARFSIAHLGDARRLYLCFTWDEVPHQLALAFLALAILFFARGFHDRRRIWFLCAIASSAAATLANAFGVTDLAITLACLLATCQTASWKWNLKAALVCGVLTYLVACPFMPPSLLRAIRADAALFPESAFTLSSLWSLAGVLCGYVLLCWLSRRWKLWHLRFLLLLVWIFTAIPLLLRWQLHFIPQPGRYKIETELALALFLVLAAAPWVDRLHWVARLVLFAGFLFLAHRQIVAQRRFAKAVLQPCDITGTIEYQTAQWIDANLPGQRVMAPGSIAQWMNAFVPVTQLSGGSYPTAPTTVGQVAVWGLLGADNHSGPLSTLWLKAFGVDALVMSGEHSPEFWKPFQGKSQFEGLLPVIWNQRDTRIYTLPRRNRSLASVIPEDAIVRTAPRDLSDAAEIRRYVAALDDPALPPAELRWRDVNHAVIRATVAPTNLLSVQVTYSAGWKAVAGGRALPVSSDGLGQMILQPQCPAGCEIEMVYDGGWEGKLCRVLSLLAMLAILAAQAPFSRGWLSAKTTLR